MPKNKWVEIRFVNLGDWVMVRGEWIQVLSVSRVKGGQIAVQGESEGGDLLTYIDDASAMLRLRVGDGL